MNIKQLDCFNKFIMTKAFSETAKQLNISTSSASRMIASLEQELGCELVSRGRKEQGLTIAGQRIYVHSVNIIREYEDMLKMIQQEEVQQKGDLIIAALKSGITEKMAMLIRQFRLVNPEINIELHEYHESDIYRVLERELVDVIFVGRMQDKYEGPFEHIILEKSHNCCMVSKNHPLASRKHITGQELKGEQFIIIKKEYSELSYNQLMNYCLHNGFTPNIRMRVDDISALVAAVRCQMGITIMADFIASNCGNDIVWIPLEDSDPCFLYAVWNKNNKRNEIDKLVGSFHKHITSHHNL